jgi:hypothetical protein
VRRLARVEAMRVAVELNEQLTNTLLDAGVDVADLMTVLRVAYTLSRRACSYTDPRDVTTHDAEWPAFEADLNARADRTDAHMAARGVRLGATRGGTA